MFAAVDIWDALRSDRPYRAGWSREKVRAHIQSLAGTHLDPGVVATFLREVVAHGDLLEPPPIAAAPDGPRTHWGRQREGVAVGSELASPSRL
jgi:hypothetical protein